MRDQFGTSAGAAAKGTAKGFTSGQDVTGTTDEDEALGAFSSERRLSSGPRSPEPDRTWPVLARRIAGAVPSVVSQLPRDGVKKSLWALAVAASLLIAFDVLWSRYSQASPAAVVTQSGSATITSRPSKLLVLIDDQIRGATPLTVELPPGNHKLEIRSDGESRLIPLAIQAGTSASQYIELGPATSAGTGRLEVTSDPAGSSVRLDGKVAGNTPLVLPAVAAGQHVIVVGAGDVAVTRTVTVSPGATASIVASIGQSTTATGGWVAFKAPFEMQVLEGGRLIGTTSMDRVMLPTGLNRLELLSTALDFRTTTSVQVSAGATANQVVNVPNGSLSVNALPWANVSIDGQSVGTTPLANLPTPIGSHEIVWTHPQLGERKRTVVVTTSGPTRIGVDFSQPARAD